MIMTKFPQKQSYIKWCFTLLSALLMNGCGEFAYKQGASARDLENTKKSCLAKSTNQAIVDKCMEDNGWFVQSLGSTDPIESNLVAEVSVNPDNRQVGKPLNPSIKTTSADQPSSGTNQLPPTAKKTADPMEIFKISSWWKMGSVDGLNIDLGECVAVLGEAHRPDNQTHQVTRGLLLCMREKGWRGLRER